MAAVKASEARGHPLLVRVMELPRLPSNAPVGLLLRFGERKPLSAPGSGFCLVKSIIGSFADQPSETNTGDEPWNGEKEMMLLCRVKQCDVFSFSLRNIWTR
jgi:hypothetical protein